MRYRLRNQFSALMPDSPANYSSASNIENYEIGFYDRVSYDEVGRQFTTVDTVASMIHNEVMVHKLRLRPREIAREKSL